jgi:RHS repeat-associated protein
MNKHVHITVFDFAANTFAAGTGFGGGRINKTNNSYDINYFITDPLGSTRVIVDNAGNITAQYNYYPFGKQWEDANLMANTNRWGYNGKEKQTVYGLNYLDYGNRMYDDFLGRWFVQDPLQEKFYSWSSYNYCMGNPLKFVDKDGKFPVIAIPFIYAGVKALATAIIGTTVTVVVSSAIVGDSGTHLGNKEREKQERIAKGKAVNDVIAFRKMIDNYVGMPSPDGTPDPKRTPKSLIGKILVGSGLGAAAYKSIIEPVISEQDESQTQQDTSDANQPAENDNNQKEQQQNTTNENNTNKQEIDDTWKNIYHLHPALYIP